VSTTQVNAELKLEELIEHLGGEELAAMATLDRTTPEFVPLALAGLPRGMRAWAQTYGLITQAGAEFALTDRGRQVVAAAASLMPEPYADVTLDDMLAQTRQAVARLSAQSTVQIATPGRDYPAAASPVGRKARNVGRQLGQRVAVALGRRELPRSLDEIGERDRQPDDLPAPVHTQHS
jgi:hypothetical protein